MASLLYRLGRFAARRHWWVIIAWLVIFAGTTIAMSALAKPLSTTFSIPGSRFAQVLTLLKSEVPEAAGASGVVAFRSDGGFTPDQESAIGALIEQWTAIDGVQAVVNPFTTQARLDKQDAQLASAREQIEAGEESLAEVKAKLDQGAGVVALVEQGIATDEATLAAGGLTATQTRDLTDKIAAGKAQAAELRTQVDAGQATFEEKSASLAEAQAKFAVGERLAALTRGMRLVSQDRTVAMAQIQFAPRGGSLDPEITKAVQAVGNAADLNGATLSYSSEITQDVSGVAGPGEIIGLGFAALVLLVMLGSLIAAGLPLLMAITGVAVGLTGALVWTHWVEMSSTTPSLALMLGLAVGIDYTLFLLNRHRIQLRRGMPIVESIALATGTSGNAVLFAGLTVIIALAALTVTGISFLVTMGLVAAATVATAVAIALTLAPAVMSLAGYRVLPRKQRPAKGVDAVTAREMAQVEQVDDPARGWAAWVQHRPAAVIGVVLVAATLLAYPVGSLRLGLPDGSSQPAGSQGYLTFDTIRSAFGAGANGPIIAVASLDTALPDDPLAIQTKQADIGEELAVLAGVQRVVPFGVSADRDTLAFQIVPGGGPTDQSTVDLVDTLTLVGPQIGAQTGSTIGITGQTVANIDISQILADALPLYLLLVVGLSMILLLMVFRSLIVPLLATFGFLLSLGVALGAIVAIYQWGNGGAFFGVNEPGPILSFLPTLLIGVLFGLAMDYQVFLVSGMRESHVHGEDARTAVVTGFNHSARVVTAAALIMTSVFGGFVFAELVMIRPMGLGLAIGVLVDAFVVRMTLTPAAMTLLGEKAWYLPGWLDRILPNVDVEGVELQRHHP